MSVRGIEAKLERIEALLNELKAAAQRPFDFVAAAAYIRQSRSHLYQLTSKGVIAHYKPAGKKIYFLKQDLDAYLLRHRRAAMDEIETTAASHVVSRPSQAVHPSLPGGRERSPSKRIP